MEFHKMKRSEKIAYLNDMLRKTFLSVYGRIVMTVGVDSMEEGEKMELFTKIREFKDFDPADDVYGERDFGAVSVDGTKFFWKIDYYDNQLELDSPDPTNMEVTCRVLTIMRADEY